MTQEEREFERQVRKGLARSILGDEWDGLVERNGEDVTVEAVLGGLDAIVSAKHVRRLRRRERWRKRFNGIKRLCHLAA
jgi:hypothetical protein